MDQWANAKRVGWLTGAIGMAIGLIATCSPATVQANSYVKLADEWGTIQPAGARGPNGGNRNWNIEGGANNAFASSGTLRFYMNDLVGKLNTDFPGGWKIDKVTLVLEHDDAGFSRPGGVNVFHFANDDLAITNGADGGTTPDAPPGNFGPLGLNLAPSTLIYDDASTSGGQKVRVIDFNAGSPIEANMGAVTLAGNYTYSVDGSVASNQMDGNLDVIGTPGNLVDPAGAVDATPDYAINLPQANTDDTLATFTTELAADLAAWNSPGLNAIVGDIQSGTDALSFILAAADDNAATAATYKGNPFVPNLAGDYNGDRTVNAADYSIWRDTLGSTTDLRANGDNANASANLIDQADYEAWKTRFGTVGTPVLMSPRIYIEASAISVGAAVPEPATCGLLVFGLFGVLGYRKSR